MKSQSNIEPLKVQDLGDGKSHFNYNIEIVETEENGLMYHYEQVIIDNPVSYGGIVSALVSERYSVDNEMSILRQREVKVAEFNAYFEYVEQCKIIAKN